MDDNLKPPAPDLPCVPEHRLLRRIGSGSYGDVWLARSATGAWRAIKVVRRALFRDARPFEREWTGVRRFEALSRENDAFVDILQTGRVGDGESFYYVMELADDARTGRGVTDVDLGVGGQGGMDGYEPRSLSWVLRNEGRLAGPACVDLGQRLARGLACLHEAGLLHRDVKPSNIVFVRGQPRLADIGLVTDLGEARSYVGTDGYIPVEGPNSPQADVFGLGKVLYEAATGLDRMAFPRVPPGWGAGPGGAMLLEINAVVLRACAAAREARYGSAEEMANDLRVIANSGSVRGRRPGAGAALQRPGKAVASAWRAPLGIMSALMVLGIGLAVWRGNNASNRRATTANAAVAPPTAGVSASEVDARRALDLNECLRLWESGDVGGALHWASRAMRDGDGLAAMEDRVRVGRMLSELPRVDATFDCGAGLFSLAFSPDGQRLATAGRDGTVRVWSLPTGILVGGPWDTGGQAIRVRFSPDGRTLMVAPPVELPAVRGFGGVGHARWLDAAHGHTVAMGLTNVLWGVFSDDGEWVAGVRASHGVAAAARRVDGAADRLLGMHERPINGLAFHAASGRLASVSDDRTARVWDVATGREVGTPLGLSGQGSAVAFDGAGTSLWTLAWDGVRRSALERWHLGDRPSRVGLDWMDEPTRGLQRLGDGSRGMLLMSSATAATRRDASSAGAGPAIALGPGGARAWSVSPDGRHLLTGAEDGIARTWDLWTGRLLGELPRMRRAVVGACFSPDGQRVAVASADGLVRVWSGWDPQRWRGNATGIGQWAEDAPGTSCLPCAVHPSGQFLLTVVNEGGLARVVEVAPERGPSRPVADLPEGLRGQVIHVSGDGQWWAVRDSADRRGLAPPDVWLGRHSKEGWTTRVLPHPYRCQSVQFDEDGRHVVTVDALCSWRRWDGLAGQVVEERPMDLPMGAGFAVPDHGRLHAVVDATGRGFRSWELDQAPRPVATGSGTGVIHALRFLPGTEWLLMEDESRLRWLADARTGGNVPIASGSLDGGWVAGWDRASRRLLHVLDSSAVELVEAGGQRVWRWSHGAGVHGVRHACMSGDGRWVAVGDRQDGVRVFEACSGQPVSRRVVPGGRLRWMGFMKETTLVVLADPDLAYAWPLERYDGSREELARIATAVSGRRRDANGGMEWLPTEALVREAARLRGR